MVGAPPPTPSAIEAFEQTRAALQSHGVAPPQAGQTNPPGTRGARKETPHSSPRHYSLAFLMAVERIVRGFEVEDNLLGWRVVRLQEQVDEQGLNRRRLMRDLTVLRERLARRVRAGSASICPPPARSRFKAPVIPLGRWTTRRRVS
jgi:hypothetical protein